MITFKICLSDEQATPLQNRMVECVTKSTAIHPIYGKYVMWRGTTELEFFTVMFVGGVLVLSLAEREFNLVDSAINYAESQTLLDTAELVKGSSPEMQVELQRNYSGVIAKREQNEITFADVMFILKWQYVEGAKVDESDMLGED